MGVISQGFQIDTVKHVIDVLELALDDPKALKSILSDMVASVQMTEDKLKELADANQIIDTSKQVLKDIADAKDKLQKDTDAASAKLTMQAKELEDNTVALRAAADAFDKFKADKLAAVAKAEADVKAQATAYAEQFKALDEKEKTLNTIAKQLDKASKIQDERQATLDEMEKELNARFDKLRAMLSA